MAKGQVSFCHHLVSVIHCLSSLNCCKSLTNFYINLLCTFSMGRSKAHNFTNDMGRSKAHNFTNDMGRSKAHNFTNDVGRSKAHNQWQTLYKFNYCTMADTTSLWKIKSSGQAKLLNHWNLKLCLHNYLKKM